MSYFGFSSQDEHVRLKSYSFAGRGAVTTLRLEIEVRDTYELHFMLSRLLELQQAAKSRKVPARPEDAASKPKRIGKQAVLALPAPERGDEA